MDASMKARLLVCPNNEGHPEETTKAFCFAFPDCEFKHICYRCDSFLIPTTEFEEFGIMGSELGQTMMKENPHVFLTGIE